MKNNRLTNPIVDLFDDDRVMALIDQAHILEQALAEYTIAHMRLAGRYTDLDLMSVIELQVAEIETESGIDVGAYRSAMDALFESGIIDLDRVVELVQDMLRGEAA